MVEKLSRIPNILIIGLSTIIGFAIFLVINLFVFRKLPVFEYGILHYEFAWTVEKVQDIFFIWGQSGMAAQATGVWWDFLYIVGYSSFIGGCILLVTRLNTGRIHNIGLYMTLTPFLAGFSDIVENIFLLIMLKNPTSIVKAFPMIATIAAGVKFGLLIMGILFFIFALIIGIIRKLKKK
jgi:hypothetical protein